MIGFEKYLIEQGWEKKVYNPKTGMLEVTFIHTISTLGNLDYRYIHRSFNGLQIIVGLHERGKPVTLISPRPVGINDDEMNALLMEGDYSKIMNDIIK